MSYHTILKRGMLEKTNVSSSSKRRGGRESVGGVKGVQRAEGQVVVRGEDCHG